MLLDPGVGLTACGTQFTAQDYIVAMVKKKEKEKGEKDGFTNMTIFIIRMHMILVNQIIQMIVLFVVRVLLLQGLMVLKELKFKIS
jgi:hypothetical protein